MHKVIAGGNNYWWAGGNAPDYVQDGSGYLYHNEARIHNVLNFSGSITLTAPERYDIYTTLTGLPSYTYKKWYQTQYPASGTVTITFKKHRFTFNGAGEEIYVCANSTPSGPIVKSGSPGTI